jgi:predicted transcriptional regulator
MARKDEAAHHLNAGNSPKQIATTMGITITSVEQYLYTKVGEGTIKRSDILFSIDSDTRRLIEDLIQQLGKTECNSIFGAARRKGHALDYDELKIYLRLRDARVSMGDMYELICRIEMELHDAIKTTLVERYGGGEKGWWREGVANEIRKCQDLREDDKEPAAEPFCYTTLVHLSKILEKQWALFAKALPDAVVNDKRKLLNELNKLNIIRNYVMHPVKGVPITEDDFIFVREFHKRIQRNSWRAITA